MSAPGPILKEIHRHKRHIRDLEAKLDQGPKAHKAHQLKVAQAEEALQNARDGIKQLKVKNQRQGSFHQGGAAKHRETRKDSISNKKEYDALRTEVAAANKLIRQLEDEILDVMSEIEDRTKLIPDSEKILQKCQADAAQFDKEHKDRLERWATERDKARQAAGRGGGHAAGRLSAALRTPGELQMGRRPLSSPGPHLHQLPNGSHSANVQRFAAWHLRYLQKLRAHVVR